jgi:hypothetical protein
MQRFRVIDADAAVQLWGVICFSWLLWFTSCFLSNIILDILWARSWVKFRAGTKLNFNLHRCSLHAAGKQQYSAFMLMAFMFTGNIVHVYWKFCSCLLEILFMFTGIFVHVYWKYCTFRQADSGPTRGGKAPAGPIKNNFSEGGLLRSVGGDLGGDGKWADASRRNWKEPDNKLLEILFMFTENFVHVYWKNKCFVKKPLTENK